MEGGRLYGGRDGGSEGREGGKYTDYIFKQRQLAIHPPPHAYMQFHNGTAIVGGAAIVGGLL